jgi:hypothetical protein
MDVNTWFCLSYSSYLVLPRLVLSNMPLEWQEKFVSLLDEIEETIKMPDSYTSSYIVNYKVNGKFAKDPLRDYRRGKVEFINKDCTTHAPAPLGE